MSSYDHDDDASIDPLDQLAAMGLSGGEAVDALMQCDGDVPKTVQMLIAGCANETTKRTRVEKLKRKKPFTTRRRPFRNGARRKWKRKRVREIAVKSVECAVVLMPARNAPELSMMDEAKQNGTIKQPRKGKPKKNEN
jgi:hypothetical protein